MEVGMKILTALITILLLFLPIIPQSYEDVTQHQTIEEYTITVPYTEHVRVVRNSSQWVESEEYRIWTGSIKTSIEDAYAKFPSYPSGRWVVNQYWTTKPVEKYREEVRYKVRNYSVVEEHTRMVSVASLLQ